MYMYCICTDFKKRAGCDIKLKATYTRRAGNTGKIYLISYVQFIGENKCTIT